MWNVYMQGNQRRNIPLTDDQMRKMAPSIFAEEAHESRSARYAYIPTIEVLNALRQEGFQPFEVVQSRARSEDKKDHTKHMIRLRHANALQGDETNEIVLLNSHDGSSSYQMLHGVYRKVCSNGLIAGHVVEEIRIPHKGRVQDNVIEGAFRIVEDFEEIDAQRENMKAINLDAGEQLALARGALQLRYDSVEAAPVSDNALLKAHRIEDRRTDLWTTFNTIQENVIRGGLRYTTDKGKRASTREIKGIDQNVSLNKALWVLADEMRKLKS